MSRLRHWLSKDLVLSAIIAVTMFFSYLPFLGEYYPDGDELEIIMRGKHLSWGYVNEPLVPYVARFWGQIFGYHMESVRLIPLTCCSIAVFLTGLLAKMMGGKALAQGLSSLALVISPIFIISSVRLDVLGFDFLFWTSIFCLMAQAFNTNSSKIWLIIGVVAGLALINKLAASLLMESILLGLCLTKWRWFLSTPWPYFGAVIAFSFTIPLVLWWAQHDWCGLEFLNSLYTGTKYRMSVSGYLLGQILYMNIFCAPIWLAGLYALLFWKPIERFKCFAFIWLSLLLIFLQNNSGIHYLAAAYPLLLAPGAIFILESFKLHKIVILQRVLCIILAVCVAFFPLIIVRGIRIGNGNWHEEFKSVAIAIVEDNSWKGKFLRLIVSPDDIRAIFKGCPDNIVYNYSFEEQVKIASKAYYSVSFEERQKTLIYTDMEASAAALDYYGRDYGLPGYACSRFTNYYWGLPEDILYKNILAVSANYDEFLRENFTYGGECGDNIRWWINGNIDIRKIWPSLRRSFRED